MHITEVFLLCSVEWDVTVQGFSCLDDLLFPHTGKLLLCTESRCSSEVASLLSEVLTGSQVRRIALILLQLSLQNVLTIARACQGLRIKQSLK